MPDVIVIIIRFRLCDPLDKHNEKDVANLFDSLAGNFAEIVQYNKDNKFYLNPERSVVTLETLCDIMVNESMKNSVSVFSFYDLRSIWVKRVDSHSEPRNERTVAVSR